MISIDTLNTVSADGFASALAHIYGQHRWVAEIAEADRPFSSISDLAAALRKAVAAADAKRKMELISGHHVLANNAIPANAVAEGSRGEQLSACLNRLSDRDFEGFHRLNEAYRTKIGFPFVVCVERHGGESILKEMKKRLGNDPDKEVETALGEINRIAALRLADAIDDGDLAVHGHLSTHVLDSHAGRPADGVAIELFEISSGDQPRLLVETMTNKDGRTDAPLISGRPLPVARYEMKFRIGEYFSRRGVPLADPPFLDEIPVRFAVAEPEGRYHVPLLVTPWSYSTYRGS